MCVCVCVCVCRGGSQGGGGRGQKYGGVRRNFKGKKSRVKGAVKSLGRGGGGGGGVR